MYQTEPRIDLGATLGVAIEQSIKEVGIAGYKQCTLEQITSRINSLSPEKLGELAPHAPIDMSMIRKSLERLEVQGKIFRIKVETEDRFALQANPAEIMAAQV